MTVLVYCLAKILLVEPYYQRKYIPLGLLKISTYHKNKRDEVQYIRGLSWFNDYEPDLIYITSLFTWDADVIIETINNYKKRFPKAEIKVGGLLATLMPDMIKQKTGITPFIGIWEDVEQLRPDWSLFKNLDYTCGFSTRGCPNACAWCMVRKHEPKYIEISNWQDSLDLTKKNIILWDNNFLASSKEHFDNVIDKLKEIGKRVDFNQGLDIRLLDEYKAKRLAEIKLNPIRFSFDHPNQEKPLEQGIELLRKYQKVTRDNCVIYLLINYQETPEEALRRANKVLSLGLCVYSMRYRPLDSVSKEKYLSSKWTEKELRKFTHFFTGKTQQKQRKYEEYDSKAKSKKKHINKNKILIFQ